MSSLLDEPLGGVGLPGEPAPTPPKKSKKKREGSTLRKAPQAPKRFKSSYICFFMEKQPEIKEALGENATVAEVSKRSAELWRNLPEAERARWDELAARDKQRFMTEKASYTGPWQVPWKRAKKDPSAPKRPMSAFLYFSQEKRRLVKAEHPSLRNTEISRRLGELWREASEEEKSPHIATEKVEREKYNLQIAEWRKNQEIKMEEARKRQAEQAAQMAAMYGNQVQASDNPAAEDPSQPEQQQQQHQMYATGGYGDLNAMQSHQQYMGQYQHAPPHYGYAASYPSQYAPAYAYAPNAPYGSVNARSVMVLGPTGMPHYAPSLYATQPDHSAGQGYPSGFEDPPPYSGQG